MAKKTIKITLYVGELVFDIQNKTHLTGRSRATGENPEEVANMQANDDEENDSEIKRTIGTAFHTLKSKMGEYLVETDTVSDNILMEDADKLTLTLSMPSNFNEAVTDTIGSLMHEFIVNMAIADWFTITNKQDAADYATRAANDVTLLRETLSKRVRPQRPNTSATTEVKDQTAAVEVAQATAKDGMDAKGMESADASVKL